MHSLEKRLWSAVHCGARLPAFMRSSSHFIQCADMTARTLHIAILDDDPSIRSALVRLLKSAGMVAQAYATSDQLFEALALKFPDCLLLDLQMQGMSGLDILKYLAQRHIRIPTMVITGHDAPGSRAACLNAGAIAYLNT